ncbi:hypothetical protein ZWY2020_002057 [Hordeum vulgare]|nr:hypothetical protein ZWY2020_002057 [Hordeum vulgare]
MDAPLLPPAYADGEQTEFVLIKKFGYLVDRQDATTATCVLHGPDLKGSIKVTFCAACPPRVSYFCVHATEYEHADFDLHPTILATEAPLVLLSAMLPVDPTSSIPRRKSISSTRLPPRTPRGRGRGSPRSGVRRTQHELCLYHSDKEAWSIKAAKAWGDAPYNHHCTDKAITIGGDNGVVALVNLGRDILFCDVLAENPKLCPIDLPPLFPESEGVGTGDPRCSRDVTVVDGFIHYTHLQVRIVPGSFKDGTVTFDGWKTTKCSMKIDTRSLPLPEASSQHTGLELDSSQISKSVPNLPLNEGTIAFERLHIGLPTLSLSLQEDDIVYFLAKIDYRDMEHTTYVLAVDLRNKMIKSIAEFGAKTQLV